MSPQTPEDVLREVREIIDTPEGESITEHAKTLMRQYRWWHHMATDPTGPLYPLKTLTSCLT